MSLYYGGVIMQYPPWGYHAISVFVLRIQYNNNNVMHAAVDVQYSIAYKAVVDLSWPARWNSSALSITAINKYIFLYH